MKKILVTGSTGFVGQCLVHHLRQVNKDVVAHSRSSTLECCENFNAEISSTTNWSQALSCVDVVIHCAARVHQMDESPENSEVHYQDVNVLGTLNLANQSIKAGVKRFIFISSIKVNGEWTEETEPFSASGTPNPQDAYGKSKLKAEQALIQLAEQSGLEVVIIRPPLVYGPGVKANFLSMMNAVVKGIPLPFGAVNSLRSFVYVENLVDLILLCCTHQSAPGKTFLVSDDEDIGIRDLLRLLAKLLKVRSYLVPIPQSTLVFLLTLVGKKAAAQRLCRPLQLDIKETLDTLGWCPKYSLRDGLSKTVESYLINKKG